MSWHWEECFTLSVICDTLSETVVDEAMTLLADNENIKWNGEEVYKLLSQNGATHVEFKCISFDEFSMRKGDWTHTIAKEQMNERRMAENRKTKSSDHRIQIEMKFHIYCTGITLNLFSTISIASYR